MAEEKASFILQNKINRLEKTGEKFDTSKVLHKFAKEIN